MSCQNCLVYGQPNVRDAEGKIAHMRMCDAVEVLLPCGNQHLYAEFTFEDGGVFDVLSKIPVDYEEVFSVKAEKVARDFDRWMLVGER